MIGTGLIDLKTDLEVKLKYCKLLFDRNPDNTWKKPVKDNRKNLKSKNLEGLRVILGGI